MDDAADTGLDKELAGCHLADERLNKRLRTVLAQVGGAMGQSIPFVCQDWANTKATYRFFANQRVTEADILAGHFLSTRDRMVRHDGLVLMLHDTTALPINGKNQRRSRLPKASTVAVTKRAVCDPYALWHHDALKPRRFGQRIAAGAGGGQVLDP